MTATAYPVDLQIERPERSSRIWALFTIIPLKFTSLWIPMIVLSFVQFAVAFVFIISQFIVLFTGKYPPSWHAFMVRVMRWQTQISVFILGLRDDYPPPAPNDNPSPVTFVVPYPEKSSRGWAIMTILFIKALALIPQIIVLLFVTIAMAAVWFVSQWAVLFTGTFPEGMHRFIVGVLRWNLRVNAFSYGLCDQYPPFSLS